jgi:membrane protein YdbS with pleckstrin-like domain
MDQNNLPGTLKQEVSVGEWIVTILITALPLIGLIMLFVWAFGDGAQPSKKNWAIATLIWYAIMIVLFIIFFGIIVTILGSMFGELNTYS